MGIGGHHGCCDVLLLTPDILEDTRRFGGLFPHVNDVQVDAEGGPDGTVI